MFHHAHHASTIMAALLVITTGCGRNGSPKVATNDAPAAQRSSPLVDRIHGYAADQGGIFANAFLVETSAGVVAIDAPLTVSHAKAYRERLDALGKPLVAVLITHGHPDHYNGVTQLTDGFTVPIIAAVGVDQVIREWDAGKEAQWKPVFKDEWPAKRTFPNRTVKDADAVTYGDVTFTVHAVGPGESHYDSYWVAESGGTRVAFIGDIAFNGEHSYVSDGHTGAWLANLTTVRAALADVSKVYPGHGPAGDLALFDKERQYLEHYRDEVRAIAGTRTALTDAEKAKLTEAMSEYAPDGKLTFLIGLGADAVAAELGAGSAATP